MRTAVFKVEGMHCGACAARVEKSASTLPGVELASVSLPAESMTLQYRSGEFEIDAVINTVKNLGFAASLLSDQGAGVGGEIVTLHFKVFGMHCGSCSARVEDAVSKLPSVNKASVSLPAEMLTIELMAGKDITDIVQVVLDTVSALGFKAEFEEEMAENDDNADAQTIIQRWREQDEKNARQLTNMRAKLWPAFISSALLVFFSMGSMLFTELGVSLPAVINPDLSPLNFAIIQLLLCLPCLWAGKDIYRAGLSGLYYLAPNMNTLVAMGSGAAIIYSLWNTIEIAMGHTHMAHDLYFESAAVLISLILLGRYFEFKSRLKAGEAIYKLIDLSPAKAVLLRGDVPHEINAADVRKGDLLLVRPGACIPVDGEVLEGQSFVDESLLTGESVPAGKGPGDFLIGGSINNDGALVMRAVRVGRDTALARIIKMVGEAQGSKAPIAALADRISLYFVPIVFILAVSAGLLWFFVGHKDISFSLRIAVSVLVVACPCAMGLATPISIMVGAGRGAQKGVLVRNGAALQATAAIDTLLFDKTGTLTVNKPELAGQVLLTSGQKYFSSPVWVNTKYSPEQNSLILAASVETMSEHPLGRAVHEAAMEAGLPLWQIDDFVYESGRGVKANVLLSGMQKPVQVAVGSVAYAESLLHNAGVKQTEVAEAAKKLSGQTILLLIADGEPVCAFGFVAQPRPEAKMVIERIKKMGIEPVMLTGDRKEAALAVGQALGIDKIIAQVMPEQKAETVRGFVAKGHTIGMVGDGVNDAPALALAHVGIAMGNGTDVAVEAGDIVLMREGLGGVLDAIELSRKVMRNIKQNLFWAFGYNVLCIPIAAGLLYIAGGPTLSPMLAALAMALSSVSVVLNALRLRKA